MPLTLDPATRRFTWAVLASFLLHILFILSDRFHFSSPERGRQIVMQATLQPFPKMSPTEEKKESRDKKTEARKKPSDAHGDRLLTGKGPYKVPTAADQAPESSQAKAEEEQQNRAMAAVLEPGAPEYPPEAAKRGQESCVLAAVYVSAAGDVQSVRILHADVAGVFDQSVIDAQSAARYLPARKNGENIPSRVLAVADFVLEPGRARNCAFKYAAAAQKINALPATAEISPAYVESILHGDR